MSSRRAFLRAAGGAIVALGAVGVGAQAPARKEVKINGRRVKVVDVHAHCMFPEVAARVPTVNVPRALPPTLVMGPERIKIMDERGIDVQALSVNTYWWYTADREAAKQVVAIHDDGIAAWCKQHADRFVGLSSPALQFPDLAAQQLEHAVKNLGIRGASIGGHVANEPPSSAKYDPFWAKAAELGQMVFMHPNASANIARDGVFRGRGDLGNIIGNPLETTFFLSRMILDGALDRFPGVKICGAHAGGFLPSYLGRTDVACDVRDNANCANKKHPREYFKQQILVDSMIFSEEGLRHLVAELGPTQIIYGTDTPYNWPAAVDMILNAPFLKDSEKEGILGGNVMKLLKL